MRKIFSFVMLSAATLLAAGNPYQFKADLPDEADGTMAYLVNYDNGEKVDSVSITGGMAMFAGEIDEPIVVRLNISGSPYAQFILEPGTIALDAERNVTGSQLNSRFSEIGEALKIHSDEFRNATTEEAQQAIYDRYMSDANRYMLENIDNPIGYILFTQQAYEMSPSDFLDFLEKYPRFKNYTRVANLVKMNESKAATAEGAKYIDFEVEGKKLSDYVGKDGKYLLVDFWASWCGPCIRQTAVIKEIYAQYKDKLNVLGVAVWDKPEATHRAIARHGLEWDCIINAQKIPTDLYGISGIPCIILISPDGTILSRDKQDDELRADVAKYLSE